MKNSSENELRAALLTAETAKIEGRLPLEIEGGFAGLSGDFERRTRILTVMLRQLEQDRLSFESAERERERLNNQLHQITPTIFECCQSVVEAVETSKSGDLSGELTSVFAANMRALDELEQVSVALTNNAIGYRTAWKQYARSIVCAEQIRGEL